MSTGKKQEEFVHALADLYGYAREKGYGLTLGDGYRDPRLHGKFGESKGYGHKHSMHKVRLAQDLNLKLEGVYIKDSEHPVYLELGEFWESLHPDARWGGRFGDANHFSFTHWGAK